MVPVRSMHDKAFNLAKSIIDEDIMKAANLEDKQKRARDVALGAAPVAAGITTATALATTGRRIAANPKFQAGVSRARTATANAARRAGSATAGAGRTAARRAANVSVSDVGRSVRRSGRRAGRAVAKPFKQRYNVVGTPGRVADTAAIPNWQKTPKYMKPWDRSYNTGGTNPVSHLTYEPRGSLVREVAGKAKSKAKDFARDTAKRILRRR